MVIIGNCYRSWVSKNVTKYIIAGIDKIVQ